MRLLVVAACFIALQGCYECSDKPVTCAAYEERGLQNWIPYGKGNKLIFINGSDKDSVTIGTITSSNEYQDRVSARNPFCNAEKEWLSAETGSYGPKLTVLNNQYNNMYTPAESKDDINIYLFGKLFKGNGVSDTGFIRNENTSQQSRFYPYITLGNNNYTQTQLLQKDTISEKTAGPYKLWITKGVGITAYELYPSLKLWTKQ